MKKFSILIAAVAMMAMTACNEKPAKVTDQAAKPADSVQVDSANKKAPKIDVEHAKPTEDGKDHTVSPRRPRPTRPPRAPSPSR